MASNSIRDNMSKEDIISNIRLTLSNDFEKKKLIIVVEGIDDILFFNGKVSNNVEIIESYSGKTGVIEIISEFDDIRVIGVRDRDYDLLIENTKIFYYDYSCLEIMLIMNDITWNTACNEFYTGNLNENSLREKIFADLKWLTLFRKLDCNNNWGVRFKGYSITNAYNISENRFDNNLGFTALLNVNRDKQEEDLIQYNIDVNGQFAYINSDELPNLTQGHDYINYFKCVCDNGRGINCDEICRVLRAAYRVDDFKHSNLYQDLYEYSQQKNILIINTQISCLSQNC